MGIIDKNIRETTIIPTGSQEYFLPTKSPAGKILYEKGVFTAGLSRLNLGYRVCRVKCPFHVLMFTLSGGGLYFTPEKDEHQLNKGSLLVLPAGSTYCYVSRKDTWKTLWFHVKPHPFWEALNESPIILKQSRNVSYLTHAAQIFFYETILTRTEADRIASLQAETLLLYLKRELSANYNPSLALHHFKLSKLWQKVNEDLNAPWNTAALTQEIGLSETHFNRVCKKIYNTTPMEYVRRLRLKQAESYLMYTNFSVAKIAGLIGYENVFAFSTAYKRYYRRSPRQYRQHS